MPLTLPRALRGSWIRSIAALLGLAIVAAACTQPAGGNFGPGGAATPFPPAPASAEPTKPGY